MKSLIITIFLLISSLNLTGAENSNGSFYVDNKTECQIIAQNGTVTTNTLTPGSTCIISNKLVEITNSIPTLFYFSGGPLIEAASNTVFSVNFFDQEIKNINANSKKAEFGTHELNIAINRGELSIVYPYTNSSFIVSTPFITYELQGGKYYIRISDKSAIVYVIEGTMQVHGDKKVDKTDKGKIAIAIPFTDPASGINDKIVTSVKPLKAEETSRFITPVKNIENRIKDVQFFIINSQPIGIWIKD